MPILEITPPDAQILLQCVEFSGRQSFANARVLLPVYDKLATFLSAPPQPVKEPEPEALPA